MSETAPLPPRCVIITHRHASSARPISTCEMTYCAPLFQGVCVMTHWCDSFLRMTWLVSVRDMTHFYLRHDSFVCVTRLILIVTWLVVRLFKESSTWLRSCFHGVSWLIVMTVMTHWHDSLAWLVCTSDMTHFDDSFSCVTWLIFVCGMTQFYVWHYSFVRLTWLICMSDMTHFDDSFSWLIFICDMTHFCVWHDSFLQVTWLIFACNTIHF